MNAANNTTNKKCRQTNNNVNKCRSAYICTYGYITGCHLPSPQLCTQAHMRAHTHTHTHTHYECGRYIFIPFLPGMQPAYTGEPEALPQTPPPWPLETHDVQACEAVRNCLSLVACQ